MSIPRVKPANWGIGDKLTSAEQNELDTNVTYALDKRSGETDTLESIVTCANEGRIVQSIATGADANTTYLLSGGNSIIYIPSTLTASREYSLSGVGANPGDIIYVFVSGNLSSAYTVTVKFAAAILFTLGNNSTADGQWASFIVANGSWQLYQSGQGSRQRSDVFTSSGSWTCPRGVTEVLIMGVGGGGAGGGSGGGNGVVARGSGGGGGGARLGVVRTAVVPGTVYTVTVGTAGVAGAAGTAGGVGGNGGDGGDTTFGALATFYGAAGGCGGTITSAQYSPGGRAQRSGVTLVTTATLGEAPVEGQGGWGSILGTVPDAAYRHGGNSPVVQGGQSGTAGASGASGGGGASGWSGAVPGVGIIAAGAVGAAGTLGAGGSGGVGSTAATGFAGGAGGLGACVVVYVK